MVLALSACIDGPLDIAGGQLTAISVVARTGTIVEVGDTIQLRATGSVNGILSVLSYDPVLDAVWSVAQPAVARVEPLPPQPRDSIQAARTLIRGLRPGATLVGATARGVTGSELVRVLPLIDRIVLRAARDTVVVGDTVIVAASAVTAGGDAVGPVPLAYAASGGARVSGSDDQGASVVATSAGPATITARFRRATGQTVITVVPRTL